MTDRQQGDSSLPNLLRHFARLAKVLPIALIVAIVVGGATYLFVGTAQPTYRALVTAQIDAQMPVVPGDAYLYQMTGPYLALAASDPVRQAIATKMGQGWSADRVADSVSVAVAKSPLLLDVTGAAPNRSDAVKLATVTVESLDEASKAQRNGELDRAVAPQTAEVDAIEQRLDGMDSSATNDPVRQVLQSQLQDLRGEIDRIRAGGVNGLSVLAAPDQGGVAVPDPPSKSVALFAALAALIVSAECLVWARGRFGRRLSDAAVERIAIDRGVPVERSRTAESTLPPVTRGLIARSASHGQDTLVVDFSSADALARTWVSDSKITDWVRLESAHSDWVGQIDNTTAMVVLVAVLGEDVRLEVQAALKTIAALDLPARLVIGEGPVVEPSTRDITPAAELKASQIAGRSSGD